MSPQNSYVENLTSKVMVLEGGVLGMWLDHEGGALINGVSALVKEAPEWSLIPSAMWGYDEKSATCKRVLIRTRSCWCLDLEHPKTVRNKFQLFLNHPVCGILLYWPEKTKTLVNNNVQLLKNEKYHEMKYTSILNTLYLSMNQKASREHQWPRFCIVLHTEDY